MIIIASLSSLAGRSSNVYDARRIIMETRSIGSRDIKGNRTVLRFIGPSPRLLKLRRDGFINDFYYEKYYREEVLSKVDFTTYFWKKYGTSDTENICILAKSYSDDRFFLNVIIFKELMKLGYKCVNLYKKSMTPGKKGSYYRL